MTVFAALREEVQRRRRQDTEIPRMWPFIPQEPCARGRRARPKRSRNASPDWSGSSTRSGPRILYAEAGSFPAAASLADIERLPARLISETRPGALGPAPS